MSSGRAALAMGGKGGGMVDWQPVTAGPQYICGEAEPRDQAVDVPCGEYCSSVTPP